MLRIYSEGEQIAYTAGDTFSINVTAEDGFNADSKLVFQIAENENSQALINKEIGLNDGAFEITLTKSEREKLLLGNYVYKITIVDSAENIVTRKSGELIVKWGV